MNKLSIKVFFILLPLAISILFFSYAYYKAREKLTIEHIFQSSQLSASLGANEISHYIEGRFIEFDKLSGAMSGCQIDQSTLSDVASNAINYTRGFSALAVSDLSGKVINFNLSANKSNRYILRKEITHKQLLSPAVLSQLELSYQEWLSSHPENLALEKDALIKLLDYKQRGEENSKASRDVSSQLVELRERRNLPKLVLSLASQDKISKLGLIFDSESYFYSRPLVDCEQNLIGFYTAVLDRTLIDAQLSNIKASLADNGMEQVDVTLVRNRDLFTFTETNFMPLASFQKQGYNATDKPELRSDLNGIMVNHPIHLDIVMPLFTVGNLAKQRTDPKFGISLVVFISAQELADSNMILLREVALYLSIALLLFAALTLYLSHYIASPIVELRKRISLLSREGKAQTDFKLREDEIGDLFTAFSEMARSIKHKESQLTKLAQEDPLTGILNRRALVEHSKNIQRIHIPATICMMDLDHFKQVNDKCGHSIGDEVLKKFCELVAQEIRDSDVFGRLGGEEFTLILPHTNLESAGHLAERIRQKVEAELSQNICCQLDHPITVSIGVVEWKMEDFNQALSCADKHLYKAKASGRNQTVLQNVKGS